MLRNGYFVWFIDNLEFMILIFNVDTFELEINAWSLEFTYPWRVWRLQDIELHNMKINVWSLESTYPWGYDGYRTLNCVIWRSMFDPLSLHIPAGYDGYRTLNCIIWRSMFDLEIHKAKYSGLSVRRKIANNSIVFRFLMCVHYKLCNVKSFQKTISTLSKSRYH